MATDCYGVFKTVYNQAIADGLATAVATAAAQAAMNDCLTSQSTLQPSAVPMTAVSSSRIQDDGPMRPGSHHSALDDR